jgi:hypothetical protein
MGATKADSTTMAGGPAWLDEWRHNEIDPTAAIARFDGLEGVSVDAMLGRWRGASLPTGHPLDGLLEGLGWWGKVFETPDRVHPLLFRTGTGAPVPLEPSLMPVGLALRMPGLAGSAAMRRAFRAALPVLRTARPAARLEERTFRGKASAAMVYRRLPITDHFRRIDDNWVLGLMVLRRPDEPHFYFLLSRERIQPE